MLNLDLMMSTGTGGSTKDKEKLQNNIIIDDDGRGSHGDTHVSHDMPHMSHMSHMTHMSHMAHMSQWLI